MDSECQTRMAHSNYWPDKIHHLGIFWTETAPTLIVPCIRGLRDIPQTSRVNDCQSTIVYQRREQAQVLYVIQVSSIFSRFPLVLWGRRARYPLTCEENLTTLQGRPATNPITAVTVIGGGGTSTAGPPPGATKDSGNKLAEIMRCDICLMLYVQYAQYAIYDNTRT